MSDVVETSAAIGPMQQRTQALQQRLQALQHRMIEPCDQVKLHYAQSLLRRALEKRDGVRVHLLQKVEAQLASLEQGDKRSLPVSASTMDADAGESPLQSLVRLLDRNRMRVVQDDQPTTFEGLLRQQEIEALKQADDDEAAANLDALLPMGELKALQEMREAWAQRSTEKAVEKALQQAPEDAGPLNAHRLIVRSLMAMQDISPEYLGRFVTQIESLLWLEQAGARLLDKGEKSRAKTTASGRRRPL